MLQGRHGSRPLGASRALVLALAAYLLPAPRTLPAVVVDDVEPGGRAQRAGLLPGERLLGPAQPRTSWDSPFDVLLARVRAASRGALRVRVEGTGPARQVELQAADWGLRARPDFAPSDLERYLAGQRLATSGQAAAASVAWRTLATDLLVRGQRLGAAWLLSRAAEAVGTRDLPGATALLDSARAALGPGALWPRSVLWEQQGLLLARPQPSTARRAFEHARALRRRLPSPGLPVARSYEELARLEGGQQARPDRALPLWRACVRLRRQHAAASLDLAMALNGEAAALLLLHDLPAAERRLHAALRLAERLATDGPETARMLGNLGICARRRADFDAAESYSARAVATLERWAPDSPALGNTLNAWALLARDRGDGDRALDLYERALKHFERVAPGGAEVPGVLANMALLAFNREDWESARRHGQRALELREARDPDGLDVAASLSNLSSVARLQGRVDEAEALLRRAVAIKRRLAPDSPTLAVSYEEWARTAMQRRDHEAALEWARQARVLRERWGGAALAESLALEATLLGLLKRDAQAIEPWRRTLALMDAHRERIGGDTAQAGFAWRYGALYRDAAMQLSAVGHFDEALHVLERGRARGLLSLLARRPLTFRELPASMQRERSRVAAAYDAAQDELGRLAGHGPPARAAALEQRLRELRAERERLDADLLRTAPRVAALQGAPPLDLAAIRRVLDAGTALIVFSVQSDATQAYVVRAAADVGATPLSVQTRPLPERELRDRVLAWRGFLELGRDAQAASEALLVQGARLYADLLAPSEPALAGARRLLIVPDGPLHALPFAALVRRAAPLEFLVERQPVHTVLSATLYAQLRAARGRTSAAAGSRLAAFGAPLPGAAAWAQPALPGAEQELRAITALFPGAAHVYLGAQATEAHVRALPRGTRYVHFALHAHVDARVPLDSALALSPPSSRPARDNGLLQSWEVFESLRLDAELVTLSACQSGLGREMGGEGLIGLVRAFHYAGARTVLASLWSVSDRSTADLMAAFYERLARGVSKDEALRQAQLHLLRSRSAASHPFHWAGFQLSGDWR